MKNKKFLHVWWHLIAVLNYLIERPIQTGKTVGSFYTERADKLAIEVWHWYNLVESK